MDSALWSELYQQYQIDPNRTLLIDADILAYRVASAAEVPINWGDDLWTLHADARLAKETLDIQVRELYRDLLADSVQMCLTDRENFRKKIYPLYKANRAKTRRPMILPTLREHILAHYTTFMKPGLEALCIISIEFFQFYKK